MLVRRAECQDACQAADVIRRSITELCATEYRNDRRVLACWLANKTEENLRRWIDQTDRSVFVAVRDDGQLAAVGMVIYREAMKRGIPMRRLGNPQDLAGAVAFFASPDADYATGQVISVSGGLTMAG